MSWEQYLDQVERESRTERFIGVGRHFLTDEVTAVKRSAARAGQRAKDSEQQRSLARRWFRKALDAGLTEAQAFYVGMHCAGWFKG